MDTLYDEAAGDYLDARERLRETRADLDTCLAVNGRQMEREGQYAHELGTCQEENKALSDKVRRHRGWGWVGKIGVGIGALFAVKQLVDTAKP